MGRRPDLRESSKARCVLLTAAAVANAVGGAAFPSLRAGLRTRQAALDPPVGDQPDERDGEVEQVRDPAGDEGDAGAPIFQCDLNLFPITKAGSADTAMNARRE